VESLRSVPAPLRHPTFCRLAGAYLANELGNWLGDIALALLVYRASGSTVATAALLIGTRGLPALAAPAIAARLSASPLRRALPGLYLGEAVLFGAMALALPSLSWPALVVIASVDGFLAVGARALSRAAIATTLSPLGLLREGNALLNVAFSAAAAIGPPAAGALLAWTGGRVTLGIDATSFILAAWLLAGIDRNRVVSAGDAALHWRERLREGLAFAAGAPRVRFLLVAQGFALLFFTAVGPLEVALATRTLHGGDAGYGILLAAWGVGMPIGGVVYARRRHGDLMRLAAFSTLAVAISYTITGLAPTLLVACAGALLGGAGNAVQWVAALTLLQEATPERRQASVAGVFEGVASLMPAVGYALGGTVAALADPRFGYIVAAGGVIVVLLVGLLLRPGEEAATGAVPPPVTPAGRSLADPAPDVPPTTPAPPAHRPAAPERVG
jgi:Transmembrane secretion effector